MELTNNTLGTMILSKSLFLMTQMVSKWRERPRARKIETDRREREKGRTGREQESREREREQVKREREVRKGTES
jgi:hypothetical protein